ncbi:MAG: helix-turn-helix domain-containing protein [Chitinophagaceae bacterium]
MLITNHIPAPPLNEYIDYIGLVHFVFPQNHIIPVKCFTPKPGNSINFFLRDPEYFYYPGENQTTKRSSAIINGQHTGVMNRHVGREFLFLDIVFQPGVLFRLTGIPMSVLNDTFIDADTVFPKEISTTSEQLKNARSYAELFKIAEVFVANLINKSKRETRGIDKAASVLQQNRGAISIDWLAKESCLSPRQFERLFIERMGIPASQLLKIVRFDRAFHIKNIHPEKDWLSIALEAGYYDYQHLVRDYKTITGLTPTSFYKIEAQAPERVFGIHE